MFRELIFNHRDKSACESSKEPEELFNVRFCYYDPATPCAGDFVPRLSEPFQTILNGVDSFPRIALVQSGF
jgi:hypothetical protein